MDTSKDYRILVAEKAAEWMTKASETIRIPIPGKKDQLRNIARQAHSKILELKYSFLPSDQLARCEPAQNLSKLGAEILELVRIVPKPEKEGAKLLLARLKWCGRTLYGLPSRLAIGEENKPEYAVDIAAGRIESSSKLRGSRNLYVTNVSTGAEMFTVITNLAEVKAGQIRAIAVLPPRLFLNEVSEAMFCSDPLQDVEPGVRPPSNILHLSEVNAIIEEIVRKGIG